jgi:hypothetical protein
VHSVGCAILEQLLRTQYVYLVTELRIPAEVTDKGKVNDSLWAFPAKDVLELTPAKVQHVHTNTLRVTLPGLAIDAHDLEKISDAASNETALAAGYACDE